MRFAFAGDRDIAVRVLDFMLGEGARPSALLLPENPSHGEELVALLAETDAPSGQDRDTPYMGTNVVSRDFSERLGMPVYTGRALPEWAETLKSLELDYIIGIHYPHFVPSSILEIPRIGVLNLHPAYLPFNRGWHTPSWTILSDTPAGATLHFMTDALDAGDIIHQKTINVCPGDTAHSLYRRLKDLEYEVFVEAWPRLLNGAPPRVPQDPSDGTSHRRADLAEVQRLDLDEPTTAREVLRKLRALTTDRLSEAAYFDEKGTRFRVRVEITTEENGGDELMG